MIWEHPIENPQELHRNRSGRRGIQMCPHCRQQQRGGAQHNHLDQHMSQMSIGCSAPPAFLKYATKFPDLHSKILPSTLQTISETLSKELLTNALSERTPSEAVSSLCTTLLQLWQDLGLTIQSFVSTVIYALENDLCYWPLVQWREENGTQGMMIFLLEGKQNDKVSWMMHRGQSQGMTGWIRSKVTWRVRHMESMKSLCYAAMHFDNVLSWTPEETLNLYCHVKPQREISQKE